MTIYRYDGTFEGLLTALAIIGERKEKPADICRHMPLQGGLFCMGTEVETDYEKFGRYRAKIEREITAHALRNAHHAFLAETAGVEMAIYHYLTLGLREGKRLDGMLADDRVLTVHKAARKVRGEAYRMKGFVRFREVREGFYYALLEPEHRILALVAPHFAARFADQNWVIHDLKRSEGIIHDASRHQWTAVSMGIDHEPSYTEQELFFSFLWQRYFKRAAISERLNPSLQKNRLPLKYRKHLVEMEE